MSAYKVVGKPAPRVDGKHKSTGKARYPGDIVLPGMLCGKILRSPFPHATIIDIDTSEAEKLPGVKAVLTGKDTRGVRFGFVDTPRYPADECALAEDKVRFFGEAVAAVAATTEDIAIEALELIKVKYEPILAVFDPVEAMKDGAPAVHDVIERGTTTSWEDWGVARKSKPYKVENNRASTFHVSFGDVEKGFAESDYVREDRFVVGANSHAAIEPHTTVASYDSIQDRLDVWTGNMGLEMKRFWLAKVMGMPLSKVRQHHVYTGGAFGGTKPIVQPYDLIACLLSRKTGRPVKVVLSREEVFLACKSSHRMIFDLKTGVKKDGLIVAQHMKIINDPGAYRGSSPIPMYLSYAFSSPVYAIPNLMVEGVGVYTNNPCCMAKRGHGVPQARCAIDSQIDMIARDLGLDPVEMALKNIRKVGDVLPNGDRLDSYGLRECIEKAAEAINWKEKRDKPGNRGVGLGLAGMFSGTAFFPFASAALVKVNHDGRITLYQGSVEFGQGAETTLSQIAAEELGVGLEDVDIVAGDTEECPLDYGNSFSGGIYVSGEAVRKAAIDARQQLFEDVSQVFGVKVEGLELVGGRVYIKGDAEKGMFLGEVVRDSIQRRGGNSIIGRGFCKAVPEIEFYPSISKAAGRLTDAYGLAATTAEVAVDKETGKVKVLKIVIGDDCGFEINPLMVRGQLESQAIMGVGDALFEEVITEEGRITNPNFKDYRIPGIFDIPDMECISIQTVEPKGPYGAKEVGEGARASVAPAIANAITDAIGVRIKEFPITPERILKALRDKEKE